MKFTNIRKSDACNVRSVHNVNATWMLQSQDCVLSNYCYQ